MKYKLIHPKTKDVVNVGSAGISLWQRKGYVLQTSEASAPKEVELEKKPLVPSVENEDPQNNEVKDVAEVEVEAPAEAQAPQRGRPKIKVVE